jgi:O-antigen ligase
LAYYYGLFAVLVVASVQIFFSLHDGGFHVQQWFWGFGAIMVALVGAALVPGYLSSPSVGRRQWALAGTLFLLTVVVAASILWSISPFESALEASRTAVYTAAFILLLPAVARWGSLLVDATIFGALLPPAIYGLLQKILPTVVEYTGVGTSADSVLYDPRVSSTVGYFNTFGMMCAMGALLVVARVVSFRSLRSVPLRALYSATGVLFLVALYFTFSRGALLALAAGVVVLLILAEHRFEVLGNMAIIALPALWVVSQARDYPGLIGRPVSLEVIEADGLALIEPLLKGVLFALAAQMLFVLLIRAFEGLVSGRMRHVLKIAGAVVSAGVLVLGLFFSWNAFQQAGGFDELTNRMTGTDYDAQAVAADQTQRFSSLSTGRPDVWKIAWENWREYPFTGTGADTFKYVYEEQRTYKVISGEWSTNAEMTLYAHSIWLSLLSDTGIFAFLAFAAFCMGCLALAFYNAFFGARNHRSRALIAGCAAAATVYLVSSSIDWNWYIPASTVPFFALAAVIVVGKYRTSKQERPTTP